MAIHEATWVYLPALETGQCGQYYCSKCKSQLIIAYNKHYIETLTGWHWKIEDSTGQQVDSMGNKHVSKYEPDIQALDEIKEDGLRRFNSLPCCRPS
jgi:hypothetical protein